MEPRSEAQAPAISLGVRVALFTSLSVLTAVLVATLVLEISGRSEARSATDDQLRRARSVASERLSRDGEGLRRLAATVARDPKFFALLALRRSERTATFRQSLEGVIREFQADADVEIFDVTDEWGATAAASQRPAAPEASRGASPLVRRALAGQGALGFRLEGGRLYRVAVVPVLAGAASPVGTLTLGSRLDESFAEGVRAATGADVLLLAGEISPAGGKRRSARPIVTTLSDAGARSVLQTIGPAPRAETRPRPGKGVPVSLAKTPALSADVPLDGATEGGAVRLLLVAPLALEAGLAPLRETLLATGAVAAAMSLLVGFIVGRRMSRRLRRLGMAAREAGAGNFEAPLPAMADDEVGVLTAEFQAMRELQRREIDRLVEIDRMKSDYLEVTAQDLMAPVEEIRKAGATMAAKNAPALGPEGLRRLRVIRGGADTLSRMVRDLGGARVVLSQMSDPGPVGQEPEEKKEEASIEIVAVEAAFHPAGPAVESGEEPGAPAVAPPPPKTATPEIAPPPPNELLDVAALVESVAVELIVAAAERGVEIDMAIEPDLLHPAVEVAPLATALREYGRNAISALSPGSTLSFSAWRSPGAIEIRVQGGATPLDIALPLHDGSSDSVGFSKAG